MCGACFWVCQPRLAKKAVRGAGAASFAAADLIAIPKFSSTSAPSVGVTPPQGPARFFTINAAMAKRDGHPASTAVRLATSTPADSLSDVIQPVPAAIAQGDEPSGCRRSRPPKGLCGSSGARLRRNCRRTRRGCDRARQTRSPAALKQTRFWALVAQIKTSAGRAQLEKANQLVNSAIVYASDMAMHGQMDRWSAPLATLKLGKGDCEDYAILKYKLLLEAGVRASDLRIVLVRDTSVRIDHAVLTARAGGRWYVLDNRKSGFYAEARPAPLLAAVRPRPGWRETVCRPLRLAAGGRSTASCPGSMTRPAPTPFAGTLPVLL